jgi:xanthine dehydrogenase YagT iron-sulfur-binding subunit
MSKRRDEVAAKNSDAPEDPKQTKPRQKGLSRRSFLERMGAVGLATAAGPFVQIAPAEQVETSPSPAKPNTVPGSVPVTLKVNGAVHNLKLEPRVTLLDALRENLGLFGTKKGCDHGQCGACTVHVNGRRINSCLSFAIMHQADEVTTIEGLAHNGELHPVQAEFLEHDAFQCGYCTSGQMMSAAALLKEPCGADDDSVRECMSGNICRCGAYPNIVAAVQAARKRA